jgi:hypothetical protein
MNRIKAQILDGLPSQHKVSRRISPQAYAIAFEVDWDPLVFVKEQNYTENACEAIRTAITLTGNYRDAQALTTEAYVKQVWADYGLCVLRLILDVIAAGGQIRRCKSVYASMLIALIMIASLPDRTNLTASLRQQENSRQLLVVAEGTVDAVAEVGQQLAWMGAALRSSLSSDKISTSEPYIDTVKTEGPALDGSLVQANLRIGFRLTDKRLCDPYRSGHCWIKAFKNPVLVKGFPILRRHEDKLGLEVPVEIMARLVDTQSVHLFGSKLFVKGFAAMFASRGVANDFMLWHYSYVPDGIHIAYSTDEAPGNESDALYKVKTARHIVGWCSESQCLAGKPQIAYIECTLTRTRIERR